MSVPALLGRARARMEARQLIPEIFTVARAGPGQLSTMARPRGGDWLEDEMLGLASLGATALVSALRPDEELELDLTSEGAAAEAAGLEFIAFPIEDRGLPTAPDAYIELVQGLRGKLSAGQNLVVHCRMGLGRASLIAAGVLVAEGMPSYAAWDAIAEARGHAVPDTPEQRTWLANLGSIS